MSALEKILTQSKTGYQRPSSQFKIPTKTEKLLETQQQINYLQNIGQHLDQIIQEQQQMNQAIMGPQSAPELPNDLQKLSNKYEIQQDQNDLLISQLSSAKIILNQINHAIDQAEILNRNARDRIVELDAQRRAAVQTLILQQRLQVENRELQDEIDKQDEVSRVLDGQIQLFRRLLQSQQAEGTKEDTMDQVLFQDQNDS